MNDYHKRLSGLSADYTHIEFRENNPCHKVFEFYCGVRKGDVPSLDEINATLHTRAADPWPDHLIAFCSNFPRNYWAYDINDGRVKFMDERYPVAKNLRKAEKSFFKTVYAWEEFQMSQDDH